MRLKILSRSRNPINPKIPKLITAGVIPKKYFIAPKTAIGKTICGNKRTRILNVYHVSNWYLVIGNWYIYFGCDFA